MEQKELIIDELTKDNVKESKFKKILRFFEVAIEKTLLVSWQILRFSGIVAWYTLKAFLVLIIIALTLFSIFEKMRNSRI